MNFTALSKPSPTRNLDRELQHVVSALVGFFRSITLRSDDSQQDLLRLLTLWFRYGRYPQVEAALLEGFDLVDIDMWLLVIPQIIARISSPNIRVRKSVHTLLLRVGKKHPQALLIPAFTVVASPTIVTPLITHHALLTTHLAPLTTHPSHHSPLTTHHAPRTTHPSHHSPLTTYHAPRITHHASRTTHHSPPPPGPRVPIHSN